MVVRSGNRNLSFDILANATSFEDDDITFFHRSKSGPPALQNGDSVSEFPKRNRRKRRNKSSKRKAVSECSELETQTQTVVYEEVRVPEKESFVGVEFCNLNGLELRQRSVVNAGVEEVNEIIREENCKEFDCVIDNQRPEMNGIAGRKLGQEESLDWKRVMAEDPN